MTALTGKTVYVDIVGRISSTKLPSSAGIFGNPWGNYPLEAGNVPALATGAVIPPNAPFTAILGDQRNGYNLEGPEDMFRSIVREENGEVVEAMGTVSDILNTILSTMQNMEIDGQSIFDIVVNRNIQATRSYGTSPLTR